MNFKFDDENPIILDAEIIRNDTYSAQREEMIALLKACLNKNEPLCVHEKPLLTPDDMYLILYKIKQNIGFSRKERNALTEAGFHLDQIYPDL